MNVMIESMSDIRRALGPVQHLIAHLSDIAGERQETIRLRRRMLRRGPRQCAACGMEFGLEVAAEAAHILALEEGGATTEDNLVLLCKTCHELYDKGRASTVEMRQAATAWRAGSMSDLAAVMNARVEAKPSQLFRPSRVDALGDVYHLLQVGHYVRAIKAAVTCRQTELTRDEYDISRILEAQIERRRSARRSLERARTILDGMAGDTLAAHVQPLYFYERGYVCQMIGAHDESLRCFEESGARSAVLNDGYTALERMVATLRMYAVETIALPWEPLAADRIERRSLQFDELVAAAANFSQPYAGRWIHNILGWKWRFHVKFAERPRALAVYREYRDTREKQNATIGFTRSSSSYECGSMALTLLHDDCSADDIREVLRLVSRALVSLLSFRTRPEGIRDTMLIFERALERASTVTNATAYASAIERIRSVRLSILDGSSFLDPYRTD